MKTQFKPPRDQRVPVMMSEDEVAAIDAWRFDNRVGTRSEAIRLLCKAGLKKEQADA